MAQALAGTELLRLVDALADGEWHSGEVLASAFGITRAALAKRMDKLREWQLDVEAQQGQGYRLAVPLERLSPKTLRAAASGMKVEVLAVTDSTNSRLLDSSAADDPQALFAEYQSSGRGRRGRSWQSPFGANLYFSLAWSFAGWPPQITALPLVVGMTCAQVLRDAGVKRIGVKWPNDLLVDGRKLGGILIEHRGEAGGACRVVIGIGLNVAMSAAQAKQVDQAWTSVSQALGQPVSRNELAADLLKALAAMLPCFENQGFAPFAAQWKNHDLSFNQPVRVSGEPVISGIARGVDENGALIVEADGRRQAVHSGEVSLRLGQALT